MNITTKLSIHDTAWFMHNNRAVEKTVDSFEIKVYKDGPFQSQRVDVTYELSDGSTRDESQVFTTKQELLDSL